MKIIYSKFNRERLPSFQIETAICKDSNSLVVTKRAIHEQAHSHIASIYENYLLLQQEYTNVHIAKAELNMDKLYFEFIQGQSFTALMITALSNRNKQRFLELLQQYAHLIRSIGKTTYTSISSVFGQDIRIDDVLCLNTANIDMTFDNVFLDKQSNYAIIDYEWVFHLIPVDYIIYRSLVVFRHQHRELFSSILTLEELYNFLEIDEQHSLIFADIEQAFQNYVHGKSAHYLISDTYLQERKDFKDIVEQSERLPAALAWGNSLDELIIQQKTRISELEQLISEYQNSCGYKVLQRYYRLRDKILALPVTRLCRLCNKANIKKTCHKLKKGEMKELLLNIPKRILAEMQYVNINSTNHADALLYQHTKNALVSIIIPVYNNASYLKKCISSALNQSYPNIEVVVIDDCSPDEKVEEILTSFAEHPRFRWQKNSVNSGISATMNQAIIAAKGQWIAFLDCDDWLELDAIEKLLLRIYQQQGSVYGYTDRINEYEATGKSEIETFSCRPTRNYFHELLIGMYTSHLKLIHKDVFLKIGLHESRFDGAQDYDMALKTAFHLGDAAFCYLAEPVYHHRIHSKQTTQEAAEKISKIVDTIRKEAILRNDIRCGKFSKLVSFVILSFEKKEMTLQCIKSIQDTVKIPYEVILFDNASSMETTVFIREHVEPLENVQVFYSKENLGCPGGRRQAVKLAKGDYVINLDNDIIVTKDWLEELIVRANTSPEVAAVCCKTVFPNGLVQFNGGRYTIQEGFITFELIDSDLTETNLSTALWHTCDWVPGGATLFTRDILDQLDYSTGYINAFEDNDISLQINKLSRIMLNCPTAKVYHHHIMFNNKQADTEEAYMKARYNNSGFIQSMLNFYSRNKLIIRDQYVYTLMKIDETDDAHIKKHIERLAQEAYHDKT